MHTLKFLIKSNNDTNLKISDCKKIKIIQINFCLLITIKKYINFEFKS